MEIQRDLGHANQTLPDDKQMHFRIGINVGDVMVKDGDIFGDGVNIAARLEGLAEPGVGTGGVRGARRDTGGNGRQCLIAQGYAHAPARLWR
mgnify:CR=1 FL=1